MKYLLLEIRKDPDQRDEFTRIPILEEAMKAYERAKGDKQNSGVYLCAILKEVDLA